VQHRSDGELFWIVQNGIRMSGMPAFGATHKERQIWEIVAFLRHLPSLTPEEEKALAAATKEAD
jgi:mono/diheme cytochrome c family protein